MSHFTITQASHGKGLIWFDADEAPLCLPDPEAAHAYLRSVEAGVQRALAQAAEQQANTRGAE